MTRHFATTSILLFMLLFVSLFMSGCATILSGSNQEISIDSEPSGASLTLNNNAVGSTPWSGTVPKKRSLTVVLDKAGYEKSVTSIMADFNPISLVSILFWDLGTTDYVTGAMWEYNPNNYYFRLRSKGTSEADFKHTSNLMAIAMTYHKDIQIELTAGAGPILDTLHSEFFNTTDRKSFVNEINRIWTNEPIKFGEAVTGIFTS